jgi:hypothetical protein
MEFTLLQPIMFMQTLGGIWSAVLESGRLSLPYSKQVKASYVDYRDVAEVAPLALTGDDLAYGTFELCALGMVNRVEPAAMMSKAIEAPLTGAEVFIIANADTVMRRSNTELLAELFPDVPLSAGVGQNETLLSIAKASRMLGYQPQHSWREMYDRT